MRIVRIEVILLQLVLPFSIYYSLLVESDLNYKQFNITTLKKSVIVVRMYFSHCLNNLRVILSF